jgi:beta-lactamase superfamily II metal-dependent hydrolase
MYLNVIQAAYGDCMILVSGSSSQPANKIYYFLIDGGPASTYNASLKQELQKIKKKRGKLDLLVVSHVDNDHINGLLQMMEELQVQRKNNEEETIEVKALWYNAFSQTIGKGNNIEGRLNDVLVGTRANFPHARIMTRAVVKGLREGHDLNQDSQNLSIPINPHFNHKPIIIGYGSTDVKIGDINLQIVGPTKKNLDELKKKWLDWLEKYEQILTKRADYRLVVQADKSIPNLSSIMFIAEEDGKKILFTGDGLGEHLVYGLKQSKALDSTGAIHVDVLKVPHHGSERNVTAEFFKVITADKYVISANGRDDNPSLTTLRWIAETAKEQHRLIEIIITNNTPIVEQFIKKYPKDDYGYKLKIMKKNSHSIILRI